MEVSRFFIIIIVLCLIAVGITLLISMFAKGNRIYKYTPSIVSAAAGIGFYIKASFFSQSFQDIAFTLMAILAGIISIVTLVTAVLIDVLMRRKPGV